MMYLVITPSGVIRCVYDEIIDLKALGEVRITRASHVEPDKNGRWWADMSPVHGRRLGPFALRSQALKAERKYLEASRLGIGKECNCVL